MVDMTDLVQLSFLKNMGYFSLKIGLKRDRKWIILTNLTPKVCEVTEKITYE